MIVVDAAFHKPDSPHAKQTLRFSTALMAVLAGWVSQCHLTSTKREGEE